LAKLPTQIHLDDWPMHNRRGLSLSTLGTDDQTSHVTEASGPAGALEEECVAGEIIQQNIPDFTLIHLLGHGGMGSVYEAQRSDGSYDEHVAIKVIRPHLALDEVALRRFRAERQILAKLRHPNIAQILDGGSTADGQPYLVMELVNGQSLDAACVDYSLPNKIRLLVLLAKAVHFAHQNLVVHRDLKPSNILVDANGQPKLMDFGIAKLLTNEPLPVTAMVTEENSPLTLAYASPEQHCGQDAGTACDIFSLGVVAFELLAGERPFNHKSDLSEQFEHPPLASERAKDTRTGKLLRGDLDAILLRALQKDPQHRYSSAEAFAEDLQNHLALRPVRARGLNRSYVIRRFLARYRYLASTMAISVLCVCAALFVSLHQRQQAKLAEHRSDQSLKMLIDILAQADPTHTPGSAVTVRDALVGASARVAKESDPILRQKMLLALAEINSGLGEDQATINLIEQISSSEQARSKKAQALKLETALRLGEALKDSEAANKYLELEGLESLDSISLAVTLLAEYQSRGDVSAVVALSARLSTVFLSNRTGLDPQALGKLKFRYLQEQAKFLQSQQQSDQARALLAQAYSDAERQFGSSSFELAQLAFVESMLAWESDDLVFAKVKAEQALALGLKNINPDHPWIGKAWNLIGVVEKTRKQFTLAKSAYENALAIFRNRYGPNHSSSLLTLNNLGNLAMHTGNFKDAKALHTEVLQRRLETLPARHDSVAQSHFNIGIVEWELGKLDASLRSFTKAFDIYDPALVKSRHTALLNIARLNFELGNSDLAMQQLSQVQTKPELSSSATAHYLLLSNLLRKAKGDVVSADELKRIETWLMTQPEGHWSPWIKSRDLQRLK
jgi:eukaryotic-like serine/threonine-protein kinase